MFKFKFRKWAWLHHNKIPDVSAHIDCNISYKVKYKVVANRNDLKRVFSDWPHRPHGQRTVRPVVLGHNFRYKASPSSVQAHNIKQIPRQIFRFKFSEDFWPISY